MARTSDARSRHHRTGANGNYSHADGLATIGSGRPISRSTLVLPAQSRAHLHQFDDLEVPNLVEMQLESYQWFLNVGLRELFDSFSPIEDFTGAMSLEFLDYTLGEPKFSPDECRERDLTYEMPMKVKVRVVNKETGELKESEVYLGELPCMTERGTFIINGAERVVVAQLSRSPGAYFKEEIAYSGRRLLQMQIIPQEGAWVDAEVSEEAAKDISVSLGVKIGQSKRMPITTLLRAFSAMDVAQPHAKRVESLPPNSKKLLGRTLSEQLIDYSTGEMLADAGQVINQELLNKIRELRDNPDIEVVAPRLQCATTRQILELFGERETMTPGRRRNWEQAKDPDKPAAEPPEFLHFGDEWSAAQFTEPGATGSEVEYDYFLAHDLMEADAKRPVLRSCSHIDSDAIDKILRVNPESLEVYHCPTMLTGSLVLDKVKEERGREEDPATMEQMALAEVHKAQRPGDPPTQESARNLLNSYFFDPKRYDLGRVGRYKLNKKLDGDVPETVHTLTLDDLVSGIRYLLVMENPPDDETEYRYSSDDIDHLRNKRVRAVGELLQNQLRSGMLRMERVARERLTSLDRDAVTAQAVISIKPITAAVRSFFGSGQLSQFMDQTNPLAELAHKRRLSVLGPGGLSRQSAKLEVRDVHHSHYGRICPIETPEGPNIGLIGSLATHARIDEYGFLLSPYRTVKNGKVSNEIKYLSPDEEEGVTIASASAKVDTHGHLIEELVQSRRGMTHPQVPPQEISYIDLSPLQVFSVPTALIPFLENDDANRALMGSNMQRQAVPLLRPEVPLVKTGLEVRAALDSGAAMVSDVNGVVEDVDAKRVVVRGYDGELAEHPLRTFVRSNQATCIHQKPIVAKGQRLRAGDPIADGPSTKGGELALGHNLTVAFALWEGYNYEDAIILSERVSREDLLTSMHIEKYEVEARDTKLGPEEITRDIPNVGEDQLKNLDEFGIVRVGAEVFPQDILVGKIAPKSQGELSAEERLVIAIFGKKAEESRDASLRMPHGEKGTVVGVQIFARHKYFSPQLFERYRREGNSQSDSERMATFAFVSDPERPVCPVTGGPLDKRPGDELRAGTNQMVRVYVAQKRKIMEGDKMAGRHGNKGVVSKILPEADMPFLPDGTPVDIILNPLGVPSRMNIGQILEMHLGLIGKHLGTDFINPIFSGAREPEIYAGMRHVAAQLQLATMRTYVETEMELEVPFEIDADIEVVSDGAREFEQLEKLVQALNDTLRKLDDEHLDRLGEQVNAPYEEFHRSDRNRKADLITQKVREITHRRSGFDPETGKCLIYDGRTGEPFQQPVAIGQVYMMKLHHLVEDKIHARSTGPYSLVTQQPLGGKAQFGGQRFGEMEVWALEAYGAAHTLQEILTIKSDDVAGRVKTYESIVKGESVLEPGVPESFKILVKELQSLALQVEVEDEQGHVMELKEVEDEFER
ncbi:MAG: DNA-directed RNA polymerase subunit beta [Armatimonadota bacterium]|nr:DNA-directed RNA polymerase subunit beta [Armatimonadota bacterium]